MDNYRYQYQHKDVKLSLVGLSLVGGGYGVKIISQIAFLTFFVLLFFIHHSF
jgi:uncharacterized membrane protein